ncbi:MAG: NADH-quinone oxidoreductase subunit N, partial [Candidatus Omnitrophica bacterium]|nr:NADH-quinone oxidoreductase subunit N [Candidatus Omnitrophota bacterium]
MDVHLFSPEIALTGLILFVLAFELFGNVSRKFTMRLALLGLILVLGTIAFLWPYSGKALGGAFEVNSFILLLKGIFASTAALTIFMSGEYGEVLGKRSGDFVLLILLATLGAFFLASSTDLITLFITVEWMTISLYILTAYLKTDAYSIEAGTKYLIMGAFSAALFLYGISFIYGVVGSVGFEAIRIHTLTHQSESLFLVGTLLILAGIGFKISAFPFQLWVADVYQGAPTPVTAFLSVGSKTAGFAALMKVLLVVVGLDRLNWPTLIAFLSAATLLYGNLGALGQTNMKRLLAYSSIGHAGYLLMGVATGTPLGLEATFFYLVSYGLSNLAAFLVVVIANRELESGEIPTYRGLAKKAPFLASVLFIGLLSLGGIPPLAGFFGKFLILQAALLKGYFWLALLGALNVIVSLYYYLSVVKEMYLKQATDGKQTFRVARSAKTLLFLLT